MAVTSRLQSLIPIPLY